MIHWGTSDGMLHFSKSDEETNSSTSWTTLLQSRRNNWDIKEILTGCADRRACFECFQVRRVTVTTKNTSFSQGLGSLLTSSKDVLLMCIVKSSLNDRRKAESYMLISLMFHLSVTYRSDDVSALMWSWEERCVFQHIKRAGWNEAMPRCHKWVTVLLDNAPWAWL